MKFSHFLILLFCALAKAHAAEPAALAWDAVEKSYVAKPGEEVAEIAFAVTNRSAHAVEIRSASTSCHCTVAQPPRTPWILAPGATDTMRVFVDLRSRRGELTKTVYVDTTAGEQVLFVHVDVQPRTEAQREMNLVAAQADRQAVLHGDCASCHVLPTIGKHGAELFQTACVICHGAKQRATMVPDLAVPRVRRDAAYWEHWIREGGEKTLMPAFSRTRGGPLDDEQIKSLVTYLLANLPTEPVAK